MKVPPAPKLRSWTRWAIVAGILLLLVHHAQRYALVVLPDSHREMLPAFRPGDRLVLYRHPGFSWRYKPGDVLWVQSLEKSSWMLARLVSQDSGRFAIQDGKLMRDGRPVSGRNYVLPPGLNKEFAPLQPGQVFLVCDNQAESTADDSLVRGAFATSEIEVDGKVFLNLSEDNKK